MRFRTFQLQLFRMMTDKGFGCFGSRLNLFVKKKHIMVARSMVCTPRLLVEFGSEAECQTLEW